MHNCIAYESNFFSIESFNLDGSFYNWLNFTNCSKKNESLICAPRANIFNEKKCASIWLESWKYTNNRVNIVIETFICMSIHSQFILIGHIWMIKQLLVRSWNDFPLFWWYHSPLLQIEWRRETIWKIEVREKYGWISR